MRMAETWPGIRGRPCGWCHLRHLLITAAIALAFPIVLCSTDIVAKEPDTPSSSASESVAAADRPITLTLSQTDIRTVFMAIGSLAGLNTVIDPAVKGTVSVSLQDVPLQTAIEIVARQGGVKAVVAERTLTVSLASGQVIKETKAVGGYARVYSLQYADVDKVKEIAATVVPEIRISGDNNSRRIVAVGTAEDLDLLESFLEMFDKAGRQVLIEARVQEVSHNAIQRLGINWTMPTFTAGVNVATGMGQWTMEGLTATLDALETKGDARLLARPQITTVSGETAPIFVGERIPIILKGAEGEGDTITYIEAGIKLEIDARIAPAGVITAHVNLEVSSIAEWRESLPVVRTRRAETTVQVQDGQPIIIGGLIREEEQKSMARLPILGSLPVLGSLFSWNRTDTTQMETVIVLTPYIVQDAQPPKTLLNTDPLMAPSATPSITPPATKPDAGQATSPTVPPATGAPTEAGAAGASANVWQPRVTVAAEAMAGGLSQLALGLGLNRSPEYWCEGRVAAALPFPPANTWRVGAVCRAQSAYAFMQTGGNYVAGTGLPYKWEWESAIGLHFAAQAAGGEFFIEPLGRLRYPLGAGATSPVSEGRIALGYRY